uniref:Heat shock protein 70 n=1 Tax=Panagrolaimus sp. ES5 TaxID=591445 RepID=A0AC34F713_9BILA
MFEEIKSKIKNGKEFGCLCIVLNQGYGNEIRKKFIQDGLKFGFKNVEISNPTVTRYLNVMSQVTPTYKPINGNVIWIYWAGDIFVWKITNEKKAKFIGQWMLSTEMNKLLKIVDETNLNKGPDIVFYRGRIDKEKMRKIFYCKFFLYDNDDYSRADGSLLKARLSSGDPNLIYLETEYCLTEKIILKIGDKEVASFQTGQKLPINFYQKLMKGLNILIIQKSYGSSPNNLFKEEHFKLVNNYNENNLIFNIDTNEIYSGEVMTEHSNENDFDIPQKDELNTANFEAIGIDLGTSRCCAAVNRRNGIQAIPLDYCGERLLPSYISYDEKHVKCGKIVIHRLRNHSKSTIFDSKRMIGRSFNDIEIDENWDFIINHENDNVFLEIDGFYGKQQLSAEKVTSDLLKYIKQKTEEFQGKKITKAVITVPAAFSEAQKDATMEAANLAGWDDIVLLPEPIAAAFAYFYDRSIPNNSTVLLFDLGGGTLDVCIFKIQNNQIQVISNTGDSKLGGRNFDTILINYFKNLLNANFGISVLAHNKYKLMLKCQEIKEDLSSIFSCS